jgi:hypothetical protein
VVCTWLKGTSKKLLARTLTVKRTEAITNSQTKNQASCRNIDERDEAETGRKSEYDR